MDTTGMVPVIDKEGNTFSIHKSDERYINGQVVSIWKGRKHTLDSIKKMKESHQKYTWNRGKKLPPFSKEHKRKISNAKFKLSLEDKNRIFSAIEKRGNKTKRELIVNFSKEYSVSFNTIHRAYYYIKSKSSLDRDSS